jgi:hypothetical protein
MSNSTTESSKNEAIIDEVEVTSDTLTGRGGLSLFVRYLRGIGLYGQLETFFYPVPLEGVDTFVIGKSPLTNGRRGHG